MKHLLLSAAFFLTLSQSAFAQENENTEDKFNKWSLEFNAGQSKGIKPYSDGYFMSDPDDPFGSFVINNYSGGVRYMFSPKFGLKLSGNYDNLENLKSTSSLDFHMQNIRIGLEAVINGARLFDVEDQFGRFNFLLHGGIQMAFLTPQMGINEGKTEGNGGIMFGITPEFRITNRIALTADFSFNSNIRQHLNWDGATADPSNNLAGSLYTSSFGVSFALGSEKMHGDFAMLTEKSSVEKIKTLEERIAKLETDLNDTDRDGVPDYLDVEPNSITGIAVDSKGRMVDQNNDGIPDELQKFVERTYEGKEINAAKNMDAVVTNNINQGYVATYFEFGKSTPTDVSSEGIDYMLTYLRNNPNASIDIIGHADEIGKTDFNEKLAKARAENVKQTLVKAGIDASRMNAISSGEDKSVDAASVEARRLVRRVTFRVR